MNDTLPPMTDEELIECIWSHSDMDHSDMDHEDAPSPCPDHTMP